MIRILILALAAAALAACQPTERMKSQWAAAKADRTAQLAAQGERWTQQYEAQNWEALRSLYSDDAVLMTQGQPKIEGADEIITFLKRIPAAGGTVHFTFENEKVSMGDAPSTDFGFVTARYRMEIIFPGQEPAVVVGRSFLVYKWEEGTWKLWRDMDNLAPDVTPESFGE